ncbi:MAG: hypothetical protein PHO37_15375 [Kiritimatiellae bacterium]|nr:hypothetical protein [Kiritimatiellia bacterium]
MKTTVQCLRTVIEEHLKRMLEQNPMRTDMQARYEKIIAEYNSEKSRVTIEQTFEALLRKARDTVQNTILNFLYDDKSGLPESSYATEEVNTLTTKVYSHIYRAYPTIPSPFYAEITPARRGGQPIFATETLRGTEGALGCFWGRKTEG